MHEQKASSLAGLLKEVPKHAVFFPIREQNLSTKPVHILAITSILSTCARNDSDGFPGLLHKTDSNQTIF